jgi:glycogen synthase
VANGMAADFSWEKPAQEYFLLYRKLMESEDSGFALARE